MPADVKAIVFDILKRADVDPEDLVDFVEGYADAMRKGLNPTQAALYALLEMQSEELAGHPDVQRVLRESYQAASEQELQDLLRQIFRAVAKKF